MRSHLLGLWGLAASGRVTAVENTSCVNCEATLLANSDWSNGVLAQGNYYQPSKTGNWLLGRSTNGEGQLELRNDPEDGYYVWNLCLHPGTAINIVITVQAGVTYDFSFEYSMDGVRGLSNTIEMTVGTLSQRAILFSPFIYTGNTDGWAKFNTPTWTPTESGDLLLTLTWRNDPNDATFKIKSAAMSAVECRNAESTKTCSAEPEPLTTVSTSSLDPELTTTTTTTTEISTSAEPEPTVTTSETLEPDVTITSASATSTGAISTEASSTEATSSASPTKGCGKRRRRKL